MKDLEKVNYIGQLFPLVNEIKNVSLRNKVIKVWLKVWGESKWDCIEVALFNPKVKFERCSLVEHVNFVTTAALDIGRLVQDIFRLSVNFDVLLAGALLHDVSKLVEFEPKGDGEQKTDIGRQVTHAVYGTHVALSVGVPLNVVHLIISHTPQTTLIPSSVEGIILAYVDYIAADVMFLSAGVNLLLEAHKK